MQVKKNIIKTNFARGNYVAVKYFYVDNDIKKLRKFYKWVKLIKIISYEML